LKNKINCSILKSEDIVRIRAVLSISLILLLFINCGKKEQTSKESLVSDGKSELAKRNTNSTESLYGEIKPELKEVFRFKPEHNQLKSISRYMTDKEGKIYFYDRRSMKIFKFSRTGGFISCYGRKGEGPGEFKAIRDFRVFGDKLVVFGRSKVARFDLRGKLLNEKKINKHYWPVQIIEGNKFLVRFTKSIGKGKDVKQLRVVAMIDEEEKILQTYFEGEDLGSTIIKKNNFVFSFSSSVITKDVNFHYNPDNKLIYIFLTGKYNVRLMSLTGENVKRISLPWVCKKLDKQDAKDILGMFRNLSPSQADMISKNLPDRLCAISHIQTLPRGFMTVAAIKTAKETQLHLFDDQGRFLYILKQRENEDFKTLPRYFDNKMSVIEETEEGDYYVEFEIANYTEIFAGK
jgi:hypothetical protein